jgi:hypothetical protein
VTGADRSPLAALVRGLAAGAAGTAAMTAAQTAYYRATGGEPGDTPAQVGKRIIERVLRREGVRHRGLRRARGALALMKLYKLGRGSPISTGACPKEPDERDR